MVPLGCSSGTQDSLYCKVGQLKLLNKTTAKQSIKAQSQLLDASEGHPIFFEQFHWKANMVVVRYILRYPRGMENLS